MKRFYVAALSILIPVLMGSAFAADPKNLMVEVRIEGQDAQSNQGLGVGMQNNGIFLQGGNRQVRRSETSTQRLVVMDGGTAMLSSIQTQPLRLRQVLLSPYGKVIAESYVFRSLGGGVRVTPRTRGDMVEIEVGAEEAQPVLGNPAATQTLRLSTLISGRMGEWILIGDDQRSSDQGSNQAGLDGVGGAGGASSGSQRVWLKVAPATF